MRTIAAFDFDGTLSTRDNVVPFMRRVGGDWTLALALVRALPALVVRQRDRAKERVTARVFAGRESAAVRALGEQFADEVVRAHMRDDTLGRAEWHRSQGHELVLVSASFTEYLVPVGVRLRFDAVLATELERGHDGLLTGRLAGRNVRGHEKVRRLERWLGGSDAFVWAYGDSAGDDALLDRADRAIRVRRGRPVTTP